MDESYHHKEQTALNGSGNFYPDSILKGNSNAESSKKYIEKRSKNSNEKKSKQKKQKNTKHFCCLKCKSVPIFEFKIKTEVYYICKCEDNVIIRRIEELAKKCIYPNNSDNIIINENDYMECLRCQTHKKKFSYYCKKCKKNICRKCANESNEHLNHFLYVFDRDHNDIFQLNIIILIYNAIILKYIIFFFT